MVSNINILQGKEKVFVAMPSYKTKQVDDNGKAVYQDICYPITKEFREKLFTEIEKAYVETKDKQKEKFSELGNMENDKSENVKEIEKKDSEKELEKKEAEKEFEKNETGKGKSGKRKKGSKKAGGDGFVEVTEECDIPFVGR